MHADPDRTVAPDDAQVDAVLTGTRALIAASARSLAAAERLDVSLPQYRILVLLCARGPQRVQDLADALGVNPSTATRGVDRLATRGLARRRRAAGDRREVRISPTADGRDLVQQVTALRRAELARILGAMAPGDRAALADSLAALAAAAGETPDALWAPW